ncbi:hypothetical protein ACC694_38360, partial [Rhizobium ruizarguesonis]
VIALYTGCWFYAASALKTTVLKAIAPRDQAGPNDAYVFNTLTHLKQMGIRDHWMEKVVNEVERLRAA